MIRKNVRVSEGLCLFVMRLIYNSRLEIYFLNLLLFLEPSAVDYYAIIKKNQQQLPETSFVIIATKFVSVFWACHNK